RMPLIAWTVAAYGGGLLAGFSGSALVAVAVVTLAALAGSRRRALVACALGTIAGAGVLVAHADDTGARQCIPGVLASSAIPIVLDDSASPGVFAHGHLTACAAPASVAVEHGTAPAGATVDMAGEIVRSQRGVLIQHARIQMLRAPPRLVRWRARIGGTIDRTFGADAPLVRA